MRQRAGTARVTETRAELQLRIGAHSDRGRVRGNNEDRLVVFDLHRRKPVSTGRTSVIPPQHAGILMIVADGMGGMMAGETASQMCVDLLPAALAKQLGNQDAANPEASWRALAEAVEETHKAIFARAAADADLKGMGTTCTAALLEGNRLRIAQVGDSRAYLGRNGEVAPLTRDQTVWETLRGAGPEPDVEFLNAPWKNMLMQALGAQENLDAVISEHLLQPGDWLLLCSDGVYRVVKAPDMADALAASSGPAEKARALTALANERGGPDNASVIVCQLMEAQE